VSVDVIEISDAPIPSWDQVKRAASGQVGEIVARSPTVTREYYRRDAATALAKIALPEGGVAHRMGDLGYYDDRGRLWFCGRKSHRVVLPDGRTLFTDQVEGVFNAETSHRTGLVGAQVQGVITPVICVEMVPGAQPRVTETPEELLRRVASKHPLAQSVQRVLFHQGLFPVDIRHNSKIFREKLVVWATQELA
jgi:acyl-CoA synthetase (AMP-forming)/AMP-acid ligase II